MNKEERNKKERSKVLRIINIKINIYKEYSYKYTIKHLIK